MATFSERLTFYKNTFLPFLENYLYQNQTQGIYLTNKCAIAKYFDLDRSTIDACFQKAIDEGYIVFDRRSTKLADGYSQHSMCVYYPVADQLFDTKLKRFVLCETNISLDTKSRMHRMCAFLRKVHVKTEEELQHQALALDSIESNLVYCYMMRNLNAGRPTFFKSTYLEQGKLRESNPVCFTLNPDKDHNRLLPVGALEQRGILLTEFLNTSEHEDRDANGSIYRMTWSLIHKQPLSHGVEIYAEVWKKADFGKPFTHEVRDFLKTLCMPIYMTNGTKNGYNSSLVTQENPKHSDSKKAVALKALVDYLGFERTTANARYVLDKILDGMREFLGTEEFYKEKIFIHESNLHIQMLTNFEEEEIKSINVYDGFYFKKGVCSQHKFDDMYDRATEQILSRLVA